MLLKYVLYFVNSKSQEFDLSLAYLHFAFWKNQIMLIEKLVELS